MKKLDRAVHIEAARILLIEAMDMLYKAEEKIREAGEAGGEFNEITKSTKNGLYSLTTGCVEILNKLGVK